MQILFIYHLQADFKFYAKIDAANIKITDPLTRFKIRNSWKESEYIKQKYFNHEFNLKRFVLQLFDLFFPQVTWRYLGGQHFTPRIILQICQFMFEVGIWEYDDHEELLKTILGKSENLAALEQNCINDISYLVAQYRGFCKSLKCMFLDIKESIFLILIHTIALVNDQSLEEQLSFTTKSETDQVYQTRESGELLSKAYYKNKSLNNTVLAIMTQMMDDPPL